MKYPSHQHFTFKANSSMVCPVHFHLTPFLFIFLYNEGGEMVVKLDKVINGIII